MKNDFKVKRYYSGSRKGELWQVYCGRDSVYVITKSEIEAIQYANVLNKDPWHFEKKGWARFKEQRT
jgi:hypothetical protein